MLTHSPSRGSAPRWRSTEAVAKTLARLLALPLVFCLVASATASDNPRPFVIAVIDEATGRGVPLVELRTRINEELARRESKEALVPIDRDPVPTRYTELVRRYYEQLGKSEPGQATEAGELK